MRTSYLRERIRQQQKVEDTDKHAVNEEITSPEVRLIGADGSQIGVIKTHEAQKMADDAGLDLVEVSPDSKPPVCRILDYGKMRYQKAKRDKDAKKRSSVHVVKELRVRYNTDKHDIETKVRNARKFIEEGDRVRFDMRFKGREAVYQELGKAMFAGIIAQLEDIAVVEELTPLIGQRMILSFAPKSGAAKAQG